MYCLMCGKNKGEGSFVDLWMNHDPLCEACRSKWKRTKKKIRIGTYQAEGDYVYNEAFASALIQYKECGDEALKDIFLYEVKKQFQRKYRGYTLCLMPSSKQKQQERGFSHLKLMFSSVGMEMLEPFVKDDEIDQKNKGKVQRMQMQEHIHLKEGIVIPRKVLLCDDTITTGATISGALSCLQGFDCQIRIYGVSLNERLLDNTSRDKDINCVL